MPQNSALGHLGIGKETVLGTYVVPTLFLPTDGGPKPSDDFERIEDQSYDANRTELRGVYDGVHDGSMGWSGFLYPEAPGLFLRGLGFTDVVTGAGPYLHTFKLPAAGTQPYAFSVTDFDTVEARGWPGMMIDTLGVKIDTNGAIKYDVAFKGFPSAAQSTPTPTFATTPPWLAWQSQFSLAGATSAKMLSGELTFGQGAETIHTLANTQAPFTTFAGSLAAGGKFRALYDATTEIARYRGNTQVAVALTLTHPTAPNVLTFTSTLAAYFNAPTDRGGKYAVVDMEWKGIYNATDAGPMQITLSNSQSAAY